MRLKIPAVVLAALLVWPLSAGSARAQELDAVVRCGGLMMANAVLRFHVSGDEKILQRVQEFVNHAAYAKYKAVHGEIPKGDRYSRIRTGMLEAMKDSAASYDQGSQGSGGWSVQIYDEIIRCYDELTAFVLYNETNRLTEEEMIESVIRGTLQAANMAKDIEKLKNK